MSIKIATVDTKGIKASKDGVIPFVLTTKSIDRDSEVILPMGAIVDSFKQNPVFVWVHDIKEKAPIGKLLVDTFNIKEDSFTSDVEFDITKNDSGEFNDPFAAMIYSKYLNGFLNAGSIRFRPKEIGDPILPGQKGITVKTWELLEFSAVPVPANPEALAQKVKSIQTDEETLEIEKQLMGEISKYVSSEDWLKEMEEFQPSTIVKELEIKESKSFAIINEYKKDVAEDAVILECPDMTEISHPHAGKSVVMKEIIFVPPVIQEDNATYFISQWKDIKSDEEILKKYFSDECKLSEEIASLTKAEKTEIEIKSSLYGFDDFMVDGAFTLKTISDFTDVVKDSAGIISETIPEEIDFKTAAENMVKLLTDNEEFSEEIRKEKYDQLCKAYIREGKKAPEYRKGDFKNLNDPEEDLKDDQSSKDKALIMAVAEEVARQQLLNI